MRHRRLTHRLRAAAVLTVILGIFAGPTEAARAPAPALAFGLTTGLAHDRLSRVRVVERLTGGHVSLVNWFQWFDTPLLTERARVVLASGRTPVISWQPFDPATRRPGEIARIAAGEDDAYIEQFARDIRALPGVVWLRFAPEMNGPWEPWGAGTGGNTAEQLVAAWDRVHAVFAAAGVANVRWYWCPNVPATGESPLRELYPGDGEVDIVGLDGYNFGTYRPGSRWRSYRAVFGPGIASIRSFSTRKIVLGEVGTVDEGGREQAWVSSFLRALDNSPWVRGFIWFDVSKQLNTRIDSSPAVVRGFARGIAALRRSIAGLAANALESG